MARKTTKARKYRGPSRPVDPRYAPGRPRSGGPDTFGLGLIAIGVVVVILIVLVASLYNGGAGTSPTTTGTGSTTDPAQATSAAATQIEASFATQTTALQTISPADAIALQAANNIKIFDVRSKAQYDAKHITGSTNVLYTDAQQHLSEFPKSGNVVVYCQ
jgi:hypothetical protein